MESEHHKFMNEARKEAIKSLNGGGIPVGAVLVKNGEIIGRGCNQRIQLDSTILHVEMACLENAGRMKAEDYKKCIFYTTLSPCEMCSGAIIYIKFLLWLLAKIRILKGQKNICRVMVSLC